jgi:hypothetical protein
MPSKTEIIYLAGPYSKGSPETRQARFLALTQVAARLIEQKLVVYSPITMTHPIDLFLAREGGTLGSDFWVEFDERFMDRCSSIYVVMLPGWDVSSGVQREIEYFAKRGINAEHIDPSHYGVVASRREFKAAFLLS